MSSITGAVAYTTTEPEYLTLPASSQYLSVSVDYLRDQISLGRLRAYRTGTNRNARILVRRRDLDGLLHPIPTVMTAVR